MPSGLMQAGARTWPLLPLLHIARPVRYGIMQHGQSAHACGMAEAAYHQMQPKVPPSPSIAQLWDESSVTVGWNWPASCKFPIPILIHSWPQLNFSVRAKIILSFLPSRITKLIFLLLNPPSKSLHLLQV